MTSSFTPGGARSPFLDLLDRMDEDTLDAFSDLVEIQVRLTGAPVLVFPKEPGSMH